MNNTTAGSNHSNSMAPWDYPLTAMDKLSLTIYCVVLVAGTIGNGLVIYVTGFRMKKTVNSIWFLNLAIADFLFTAFLVFTITYVARGYEWPFGDTMCKINSLITTINMFASIFLLAAISLDRCLSTWLVVWAQNKRTPAKAQLTCAGIWLTALVCSLPYSVLRETKWGMCLYADEYTKSILTFSLLRFVVGFIIPLVVITVSYLAIGMRASRLQRGKRRKPLRVIISIILAFFMCWFPFHVVQILRVTNPQIQGLHELIPLSTNLAFMNSCLNPILYVFMCDEFQKKLQQSVCHVLESALAEDALSFVSSRSLASHLSRISRKSDAGIAGERKNTATSLTTTTSTDNKAVMMEEIEGLYSNQDV